MKGYCPKCGHLDSRHDPMGCGDCPGLTLYMALMLDVRDEYGFGHMVECIAQSAIATTSRYFDPHGIENWWALRDEDQPVIPAKKDATR